MTLSTSTLAYNDCYAVMDAAIADEKGVGVRFATQSHANIFRMRCHYARKIDRRKNAETYEKGTPQHGVSHYDRLIIRVRENGEGWWVLVEENAVSPGSVVSLSTGKDLDLGLPPPAKPLALAAPEEPEPELEPPKPTLRRL